MHEYEFASRIVKEAMSHGNVNGITIEIGELAPIPAEELIETLKTLVDWRINLKKKRSRVECRCGYRGRARIVEREHSFVIFVCPGCGSVPEVTSGNEIILKEVVVSR